MSAETLTQRARVHAALSDEHRLAIIDSLGLSDRAPSEFSDALGLDSNLLAHHLRILEAAGLIERVPSQGDRRRRYIRLRPEMLETVAPPFRVGAERVVFVCTENAGRSLLAEAIWNATHPVPAVSGGTRPAPAVHEGTLATAARRGLDLGHSTPHALPPLSDADLVITVCDRAHEQIGPDARRLHWSVPDPAISGDKNAYEVAAALLARRIDAIRDFVTAV